ncbi:SDR family oxidoreductase [Paenibacillus algorifonticola]|uniref:SDR family oxidoreductase n=1 Tax=Paenibacillus TaxID=44249 RepID=UPI0015C5F0D3|nr:SDR family oxidoreductase [Paenibacillus sp. E222]QLG40425.1 SDR family oxidoreductase [Paenibacillus sp. E222]
MTRLNGKRALITGGTSGIGLETAKQFLAEGAELIVTGVTPANVEKTQKELGNQVLVLQADSRDLNAQLQLAERVEQHFGKLDIAFLNAGVSDWRPFEQIDEEAFDRLFAINVKAPFFLMQALTPVMANPSSVVLMGSSSSHAGYAHSNAYAATKGAISTLTKAWNSDLLSSHGIRFNTVSPGPIDTPLYDKNKLGVSDEIREMVINRIRDGIPAGRMGTAEEIAKAVVYLASDESRFTIGVDLVLDGAQTIL